MNLKIKFLRNTNLRNDKNFLLNREWLNSSENGENRHKCKESHQEAEVIQNLGLIKGVIVVGTGSGRSLAPRIGKRSRDPEARKENCGSDLVPAQDQDPSIGVEAGIAGWERKRMESLRRFSKSLSRTASPLLLRGRSTATDAQEALAGRLGEMTKTVRKGNGWKQ